jgi:hypothetical protein
MKKLVIAAAMIGALATAADAGPRHTMHQQMQIQLQMVQKEMSVLKARMKALTAYQRQLINMMNNESSTHSG